MKNFFLCATFTYFLSSETNYCVYKHRLAVLDRLLLFQNLTIWDPFAKQQSKKKTVASLKEWILLPIMKFCRLLFRNSAGSVLKPFVTLHAGVGDVFWNFHSSRHQAHNSNVFKFDKISWAKFGKSNDPELLFRHKNIASDLRTRYLHAGARISRSNSFRSRFWSRHWSGPDHRGQRQFSALHRQIRCAKVFTGKIDKITFERLLWQQGV